MMEKFFAGKRILITGGAGTVGRGLIATLNRSDAAEIRILDNHEAGIHDLTHAYYGNERLRVFLADIRDGDQLNHLFSNIDYVIHAAALKHVPFCETTPDSTVATNINGVQNVIQASRLNKVKKVIFTSSDKAVNPTNVMGTTKLMGEKLFSAANVFKRNQDDPIFTTARFGNVAGSRGSVIPLFCEQLSQSRRLVITDPQMTRFVMTIDQAVDFVLQSLMVSEGGEVFISKMPVVNIQDLASAMIQLLSPVMGIEPSSVKQELCGVRPGEKTFEELINAEEVRRTHELPSYLVVLPALSNLYKQAPYSYAKKGKPVSDVYRSDLYPRLSVDEICGFLRQSSVLPEQYRHLVS